jgi:inward rectifier potassium channel
MRWSHFFALFSGIYLLTNAIFAFLYMLTGPDELQGNLSGNPYVRAFFFSVHTLATVGYGNIFPVGRLANVIVTFESMASWALFALFAGLVFSRFSRPVSGIKFSNNAIIAPYRNGTALEFRVVNSKSNPLLNLEAIVVLSRFENNGAGRERKYYTLKLERTRVAFFPLNWTVVHAIDDDSPFRGWTKQMLIHAEAELLILMTAIDETFAQSVNSRASYSANEIEFGRRFAMMYQQSNEDKTMVLDLDKLNETETVELPA